MASIGQKLSFIHPWNWAWALLHVWWMNTWREVSSATQIWPTVTMLWVMWSMPKVSGKKECGETQQRVGCVWLGTIHLAYSSQAPDAAGTEQGSGERTLPLTRPSSSRGGGRQFRQQHWHHMPKRATTKLLWRTPTNTNQAVQEHYCLPITEVYCRQCQKNKLLMYRTKHIITSKLHTEEMSVG